MTQPDERSELLANQSGGCHPAIYVNLERVPHPHIVHHNNELTCVWVVLLIVVTAFLCIPVIMILHNILIVMTSLQVNEAEVKDELIFHRVWDGQ